MVEGAVNSQCSLKHGLGGSDLLNIYGSLTSKDFFYAPFSILVCIISLPVCHNMEDYHCFCLPFLLLPLTLF